MAAEPVASGSDGMVAVEGGSGGGGYGGDGVVEVKEDFVYKCM